MASKNKGKGKAAIVTRQEYEKAMQFIEEETQFLKAATSSNPSQMVEPVMIAHQAESSGASQNTVSVEPVMTAYQAESLHASQNTVSVEPVMTEDQAFANVHVPALDTTGQNVGNIKMNHHLHPVCDSLVYEFDNKKIQGPLISEIRLTSDIANEYATADPNFVVKTRRLAETHPFWRRSKGDGNCGWRAILFGYLELLLRLNDAMKIAVEMARLKWMRHLYAGSAIEDTMDEFADSFFVILDGMGRWIEDEEKTIPSIEELLWKLFDGTDPEMEMMVLGCVYFLRVLASLWLKQHRAEYEVFINDDFDNYVNVMQQATTEIDQIGLKAMHAVVLEQAGFGLEILDLNRGQGSTVNVSRFEPPAAGIPGTHPEAWIRLLYRPGHYDIVYPALPGLLG